MSFRVHCWLLFALAAHPAEAGVNVRDVLGNWKTSVRSALHMHHGKYEEHRHIDNHITAPLPPPPAHYQHHSAHSLHEAQSATAEGMNEVAVHQVAQHTPLKVAYAVFVSDLRDATMRDVLAVQGHGLREAAKKSKHHADVIAVVPTRFPQNDENLLSQYGFKVIRKPLPVDVADIDPVKGAGVITAFKKTQGSGDANNQFLMAEENLKYWPLSMTEYDRVLMLDADVMVLDPMDELMEREEDFVGTYDHGLDVSGSTVPPVQGGFLLYRPKKGDFEEIQKIIRSGDWDQGGTGWHRSGIGYCYGGTGPDGLLAFFYHKDALPKLKEVGKKGMRDGPHGQAVPGVRMFAADRSKYDVLLSATLEAEFANRDPKQIVDGIKSFHFTGNCIKPWQCFEPGAGVGGKVCAEMIDRWFEMRASLEQEKGLPVSHKGCVDNKYEPLQKLS